MGKKNKNKANAKALEKVDDCKKEEAEVNENEKTLIVESEYSTIKVRNPAQIEEEDDVVQEESPRREVVEPRIKHEEAKEL